MTITRAAPRRALCRRDRGLCRRAEQPARRGVFLELRISRPLYALGHRHHRSAAGDLGARPRDADRGAERAAARCCCRRSAARSPRLPKSRSSRRRRSSIRLEVAKPGRVFTEEERSRVPSVFTVLRAITALFQTDEDANLGLYGAFGYDLAFQFDPVDYKLERKQSQRDLVLYPARRDPGRRPLFGQGLDRPLRLFAATGFRPRACRATSVAEPFRPSDRIPPRGDHEPGEYAELVDKAKESFRRGDLFEVVPGQMFYERCETQPSEISPAAEGHQPVALFLLHQSRRGRISDRRLAGNVRAGQWPPRRDLPDLRHDQARRRRHLRLASRS